MRTNSVVWFCCFCFLTTILSSLVINLTILIRMRTLHIPHLSSYSKNWRGSSIALALSLPFFPYLPSPCSGISTVVVLQEVYLSAQITSVWLLFMSGSSPLVSCPCIPPCMVDIAIYILPVCAQFS